MDERVVLTDIREEDFEGGRSVGNITLRFDDHGRLASAADVSIPCHECALDWDRLINDLVACVNNGCCV